MRDLAYRRLLLTVLLLILAANYTDGLALGLMLQDIKADLHLTDTQLGFLTGMAFAFFYALFGIPIARWADRGNRVTIIVLSALTWSVMVALCGMTTSFIQLVLIRVAVGIGEAGCVPPAHSLIADDFDRGERARAVSIYLQGNSLSILLGYFLAGWLNQLYGWRVTFEALGFAGLVPAAFAWLSLREPRRELGWVPTSEEIPSCERPTLREVCLTLWRNRTFRHLLYSFSVVYFFSNGIAQWQPAFFMRSYALHSGELGTWFAVLYGAGGMVGTYLGGEWACRYAARNERLQLRAMAIAYCVYGLVATMVYLVPNRYIALVLVGLGTAAGAMTSGPLFATIQSLIPQRMRAMSIALVYLFANLIGLGLGPLAAGTLSDALKPMFGAESLRVALLILCPGFLWVAWHLWTASSSVDRDLLAAHPRQVPVTNEADGRERVGPRALRSGRSIL